MEKRLNLERRIMMKNNKVIIIGAGPAGITCAIYLKRAGYDPYLIENSMPGGKISLTYKVENYPGFDEIMGSDLAFKMMDQLNKNNIAINFETVLEVKKQDDKAYVKTDSNEFISDAVVIATGTKEKKLGIKGEEEFFHKGISFCAVCDGGFYKGQPMAIIGGGNSALEEALYLDNIASKLYLIHRRNEFRGDQIVVDEIRKKDNIEILTPYIPLEFKGEENLTSLVLENVETKEIKEIEVKGVFEYVGAIPNTSFIKDVEILNDKGYVMVNNRMETKVTGIYAIGDVIEKELRQIVTASSDGAIAATTIGNYLKSLEN